MEVIFYTGIMKYTGGTASVAIDPGSCPDLRSLIGELGSRFGKELENALLCGEGSLLLVNGRAVMTTGGVDTPLKQEDIIEILPAAGAG